MAQRKTPEAEPPAPPESAPAQVPMAVWVNDRFVCVEIVDLPPAQTGDGVCRCPACHGAAFPDTASKFYPGTRPRK